MCSLQFGQEYLDPKSQRNGEAIEQRGLDCPTIIKDYIAARLGKDAEGEN